MALNKRWAGRVFGTNTGNVFVKLEGEDKELKGTLHVNDTDKGTYLYDIEGSFDGSRFDFTGKPRTPTTALGALEAYGVLQVDGNLNGEWSTDAGTAGTLTLFPHLDPTSVPDAVHAGPATLTPDQMHTARYQFGAVQLDREQIDALADDLQRGFKPKVIVTFDTGTEQSRFLDDFKKNNRGSGRAKILKLFVREPDGVTGIDKSITVEFGPESNWVMVQGGNEAWVLGEREKLKREIGRFERTYAIRGLGVSINQVMLLGALVFMPSLPDLGHRIILILGVIALAFCVNWIDKKYLPNAELHLSKRNDGLLARAFPSVASWLVNIGATVVAALLGAWLKGVFKLPGE